MKQIHPNFGFQIDFKDIVDSKNIIDLIKKHSLLVVDNAECLDTKEDFFNFINSIGPTLPKVTRETESNNLSMVYLSNEYGVDEFIHYFDNQTIHQDQDWHQDGPDYFSTPILGVASVKVCNSKSGTRTADTLFLSTRCIYNTFSNEFKEFLKKLTLIQVSPGLSDKGRWTEKILTDNLKNKDFNSLCKQLVHLKKKLGNQITKPLIAKSKWGFDYLDFNPMSTNTFKELSTVENHFLNQFLTEQLNNFTYCYYHRWQPNQMVFYDNQSLLHRFLNNAIDSHVRKFWRLQISIDSIKE